MKYFISSLIIALSILSINACSKKNVEDTPATNNEQSAVENEQKKPIDTNPDGTYECKQGPQRCELTISGNTWNAEISWKVDLVLNMMKPMQHTKEVLLMVNH
jgi:hypothetical protein